MIFQDAVSAVDQKYNTQMADYFLMYYHI